MRFTSSIAVVLAVVLSSSCAEAQSRRAPSDRDIRLYARLMAMTDSRTLDRALVDSSLASSWAPLRAATALAIGQTGAARGMAAVAVARGLVADRDLTVASNAAYALGLLRDSAGIGTLASALTGPPRVAREAAWSLGEIGTPARSIILAAMASPGTDEARMIQLLLAAAKLRPVPVEEMRPYLRMSDRPSVVWAAVYAISRTRAAAGVRHLIDLAASPLLAPPRSSIVRGRSESALGRAGTAEVYISTASSVQRARSEIARGLAKPATGDSLAVPAIATLLKLAGDVHPHVRINAVRSLATFGPRAAAAVTQAASDSDANVRVAAAQSVGTVLDSAAGPWTALWQRDTGLTYRGSVLASAARVGAMRQTLSSWLTHSDWRVRAAAVNALDGSQNRPFAVATAMSMLRDPDARVRAAAFGALTGTDTAVVSPGVHAALVTGLTDADFMVRATALGALARHARARDVPAVLASYEQAARDSSNDARIAGVRYLAAAWRRDSASFSPALRSQLSSLRPSDDPLVRAEAANVGVFAAWPSPSGQPRPLSWYENVIRSYVLPALAGRTQRATIQTRRGDIVLELFGADAPITVWNFMNLARSGYYRGTGFHRVVPNFVAQDGDPRGDGNGGPGYSIRDEMNPRRYDRGALGMALSGPDTGGSQYFITHSPQPHLDGHYTVFGRVVRGYAALDSLVQGDRILRVTVQ
ncbi:MAG: peptidylprolyl isomerase [Gemmatimonadaceae bacterium]|nr:peptidylprolyl isomerase [Gemmatimonadaceae bacterium]